MGPSRHSKTFKGVLKVFVALCLPKAEERSLEDWG